MTFALEILQGGPELVFRLIGVLVRLFLFAQVRVDDPLAVEHCADLVDVNA